MSTACATELPGMADPACREIEGLRGRYEAIAACAVTPMQKSEIAHVGVKPAELLHLAQSNQGTRREAFAIPLLASWIAGRIVTLEAQQQSKPLFFPQPC